MSKTIKMELELPAPPEGWGEVEYREVSVGDYFWNGTYWILANIRGSFIPHFTARRLAPLWTPPDAWHQMFGDCWLSRDKLGNLRVHQSRPDSFIEFGVWECNDYDCLLPFLPELLPPDSIPWEQCCFKIGEPKE